MKTVELQQVTSIIAGQSPDSSTYNSIADGLPFFQGKADFQEKFPKVRIWCNSAKRKEAEPGDILMSVRAPVGSVNICNQKCIIGRGLSAIRPHANLNNYFLYYYLKCNEKNVASLGTGSTFKAITQTTLKKLEVPLPPLDDQIRIAILLSKVENLISRRREQLKQLDELLKSVFLEMFGFNNGNVKKWIIEPLSTCTEIVSGVTKGKKYNGNKLREVPYMRVANVKDGYLNLSEIKTIEVTEAEIHKYKLISGDLLLTEGGDPDKLGRGAVWNCEIEECIHQNHIFRVRAIGKSVNPVFLSALMASKYGKSYFFKAAKQTTGIASINSTQLKMFPLIKPPIDLQNRFAEIVEKVECLKSCYQRSLAELQSLYGTFSQQAFKAELDLSRVPIAVEREALN
jgi:type I restriction enzyme, S subunit